MPLQVSSNKNVSRNTISSTDNIGYININTTPNTFNNAINSTNNAPIENYDLDDIEISNEGTLSKDSINFSRIATSTANVNSGKFVTIKNTNYWGDKGELTYKIRDDGTVAIMENGTILGFTDLEGISKKNATSKEIEVLEENPPKTNQVPAEQIMVKEKETSKNVNKYVPIEFEEPTDPIEKEAYDKAKQMNREIQDIFERNGMKVDIIYDYRPHNSGIGYANDRSHHRKGQAVDIIPQDGDFEALRDFLLHNEEMREYLESHGYGVIDETHQKVLEHTGGPTEHFHIGPDKMAKRMYKGWDYLETYCNDVKNAQSEEEVQIIKQEMLDRLKGWDFRDYEMEAFFEDADKMLENK